MIKKGKLPIAQQDKVIAAIQAGGKTIEELTGRIEYQSHCFFLFFNY